VWCTIAKVVKISMSPTAAGNTWTEARFRGPQFTASRSPVHCPLTTCFQREHSVVHEMLCSWTGGVSPMIPTGVRVPLGGALEHKVTAAAKPRHHRQKHPHKCPNRSSPLQLHLSHVERHCCQCFVTGAPSPPAGHWVLVPVSHIHLKTRLHSPM
jgi:hypothetical protein